METAACSFLFSVFKYKIKVIWTAMIYLFFIEIFKALSSTEMHSCLRCSVRAARRHKGTPELELVRKQIFCPAKPSKISFSLLLLLFWIRAKSYISKCFHMVEFYRKEIIFCLIYQSSSFLCKMHIWNWKHFIATYLNFGNGKTHYTWVPTKSPLPFSLSSPHFVKKGHFGKVLFSIQELFFQKRNRETRFR